MNYQKLEKPILNEYGDYVVGYDATGGRNYNTEVIQRNATITKVSLSNEDFGVLTCWLTLQWPGGGQGMGGYSLSGAFAYLWIDGIMRALDKSKWENVGGPCRIRHSHGRIYEIGHVTKDKWFNPDNMHDDAIEWCKKYLNERK